MKKILAFILLSLLITTRPLLVSADSIQLEITGNGSDSDSSVHLETTQDTTVVQTTNTQINNDVDTTADTGNNQIQDSTASDTSLNTGDITTTTDITNSGNSNSAHLDTCCGDQGTTIAIADNGAGSANLVDSTSTTQTTLVQDNTVTINNVIITKANTGGNSITDSTASTISLATGDIHHQTTIDNHVNSNSTNLTTGGNSQLVVTIKHNGAGSTNSITVTENADTQYFSTNLSHINNHLTSILNTGSNTISGNTGVQIALTTGDIFSLTTISNWINRTYADISDCCGHDDPTDPSGDPDPTDDPTDPAGDPDPGSDPHSDSNSNPDNNSDSDDNGGIGGAFAAMLPATGGILPAYLLANLFFALLGFGLITKPWRLFQSQYLLRVTILF